MLSSGARLYEIVSKIWVDVTDMLTKSVVNANSPGHALLPLNCGKHLGGVLESYGAFSQGVADGEEIYEPK